MDVLAANGVGRKNRPRCGSARRKLRVEREGEETTAAHLAGSSEGAQLYHTVGTTACAATRGISNPSSSLRVLYGSKDEEERVRSRDETTWVEAEELVTALKASAQSKPPPRTLLGGQADELIFAHPL
mmetsp:Transcript_10130/g.16223  ORF Transcript_10130/g.16223 Transcript_10130/m.16223 type:complete len:128 (+) Transcript_10130:682-1065(+)